MSLSYIYVTDACPSAVIVIFCSAGVTNPVLGCLGAGIVSPVVPVPGTSSVS